MKEFLNFIERHKNFVKRIIIFIIAYIAITIVNTPAVENLLIQFFGEYLTYGIEAVVPTFMLTTEI